MLQEAWSHGREEGANLGLASYTLMGAISRISATLFMAASGSQPWFWVCASVSNGITALAL